MSSLVLDTNSMSAVERQIMAALAGSAGQPSGSAISILRGLGRPERLSALLTELLDDDSRADAVAARSHPHALGFDKFILATFGEFGQLRMHVWWPGRPRMREHVHDHRFDFSSVVVAGRLDCRYYHPARSGAVLTRYRESSRDGESAWRFDLVDVVSVRETLAVQLTPGSSYSMPYDLLHRVEAASTTTVTLMLQGRLSRDWSSVLVDTTETVPARVGRRTFDTEEMRGRLMALRSHLAA
ncbi:hypothetical protein [Micromonospora sp. RL09-050-HVF-A]|uniref:hypothetical protein n=1 Tax=Micromonospora sp. RL09-050-HVF-A TaxID=1703433 RepID=UPI001C5F6E08|nr:hypothetical protein [Micromonospora sp. RL09-050-HVF-A]MBW4704333.1 hypothetical protein [Micromonospora sp. RL09-050-HVF-A]